jgi:class 3 adenylate cyclase
MSDSLVEVPLLIVFVDLTRYAVESQRRPDTETAKMLDRFYEMVGAAVSDSGGTLVKFIGDAALIAFPEDRVNAGVKMLLSLKETGDRLMSECGWECRLNIRVNFGPVIAGPFGAQGSKRFDIIGKAVNVAAMLDRSSGISLSGEAFRRLGPELRHQFKKHTPPITYIRNEDSRPTTKGKLDRVMRSAEQHS